MLMQCQPVEREIPETLQNLIRLRDVVFPVVFEKDKQGLVKHIFYWNACNTYGCLAGWDCYLLTGKDIHAEAAGGRIRAWLNNRYGNHTYIGLFNNLSSSSLQDRHTYLCDLIESSFTELGFTEQEYIELKQVA